MFAPEIDPTKRWQIHHQCQSISSLWTVLLFVVVLIHQFLWVLYGDPTWVEDSSICFRILNWSYTLQVHMVVKWSDCLVFQHFSSSQGSSSDLMELLGRKWKLRDEGIVRIDSGAVLKTRYYSRYSEGLSPQTWCLLAVMAIWNGWILGSQLFRGNEASCLSSWYSFRERLAAHTNCNTATK